MSRAPTKVPGVACSHCGGTGRRALPSHLWLVLLAVRRLRHASARDVKDALLGAVGVTAYNNQLEQLRELGFVARENVTGRDVVYFLPRVVSRPRLPPKRVGAVSTPRPSAEENPRREATRMNGHRLPSRHRSDP